MTGVIIQARLNSSRLPAKSMLMLPTGRCIVDEVVYRCGHSKLADKVVLATPDSILANRTRSFLGSEDDVYGRYVGAAQKFNIDLIVRVTADCPLITADIIDDAISQFRRCDAEFVYNSDMYGGDGFDVEVFSLKTLIRYGRDKEHVTGNMRKKAVTKRIESPDTEGHSIDTLKDYLDICEILK